MHTQKYNKLVKAIQTIVPVITELKFGCKVIVKGIAEDNPGCETDIVVDDRELKNGKIGLGYFGNIPVKDIQEIIGRDITLEDCLITAECHHNLIRLVEIWTFNTPLQDQSNAVKEFLAELILNK